MNHETDLYEPVKHFLESRGFDVKSEVNGCDIVARKDDDPPVIVELKMAFSLELVLQGVDRQRISDDVYLAIRRPETQAKRRNWRARRRRVINLCRRLGVGLMLVDLERRSGNQVEVLIDPAPYRPRPSKRRQTRLTTEFSRRSGDPNVAGATRRKIVTAYRQDALRCAMALDGTPGLRVAEIRDAGGVPKAGSILQKNHYGWFERVSRGVYCLSSDGKTALEAYAGVVAELTDREPDHSSEGQSKP